jgi:hypothetical protein
VVLLTTKESEIERWARCDQFLTEQVAVMLLMPVEDSETIAKLDAAFNAIIDDMLGDVSNPT